MENSQLPAASGMDPFEFSASKVLTPFQHFDLCDGYDELFVHRLRIEEGMALLKKAKAELDEELVRQMREREIASFETLVNGEPAKVWFANEKKEKIRDTRVLKDMLFSKKVAERDLALEALSGGQGAWKLPKVKILADTLGLKRDNLIETAHVDKVKVEYSEKRFLEAK